MSVENDENKGRNLNDLNDPNNEIIKMNCLLFIVISAKSTDFTTNTKYHVESSVDEPHRLQQQVLVLVS